MRDRTTSREDFIFFTDRLSTFLSEKAMEFLPYQTKTVTTPVSATYAGKQLAVDVRVFSRMLGYPMLKFVQHVCGISILRSCVPVQQPCNCHC